MAPRHEPQRGVCPFPYPNYIGESRGCYAETYAQKTSTMSETPDKKACIYGKAAFSYAVEMDDSCDYSDYWVLRAGSFCY